MSSGESLSDRYREEFSKIAATWHLEDQILENHRVLMEQCLARLDHRVEQCGGWEAVGGDDHAQEVMLALNLLLKCAREAYDKRIGEDVRRGRSAGGKARPLPKWQARMVTEAKVRLGQDLSRKQPPMNERDIVAFMAKKFGKSPSAVRRVLQREGVISPRKKRAK